MTNSSQATGDASGVADTAQYLTFVCAGEEYGVDILRVQEIKGWEGVTRVPYAPSYVLGVMNLRGIVVPVLDVRARFGLEARPFDTSTVVVVVRIRSQSGEKTVGLVVDAVSDVHSLPTASIKPTPDLCGRSGEACVNGLVTVDGKMVMLLDIDRLVNSSIEDAAPATAAATATATAA